MSQGTSISAAELIAAVAAAPGERPAVPANAVVDPAISAATAAGGAPAIGLAIVCKQRRGDGVVEVLLQRRADHLTHPGYFSFPGGRVFPQREPININPLMFKHLMEQCGSGFPLGLPPMQGLTQNVDNSGKTFTTVLIVRPNVREWQHWLPKSKPRPVGRKGENGTATSANGNGTVTPATAPDIANLVLGDLSYPVVNGYAWVEWSTLVAESKKFNKDQQEHALLHPGLTYWFRFTSADTWPLVFGAFEPCRFWLAGLCKKERHCAYYHPPYPYMEMGLASRASQGARHIPTCRFYNGSPDSCDRGANCSYLHIDQNLKPSPQLKKDHSHPDFAQRQENLYN